MKSKNTNKIFILFSLLIIAINCICKDKLVLRITFIVYLCLMIYKLTVFFISFCRHYDKAFSIKSNFLSFLQQNHRIFYNILEQESIILKYGFLIWRKSKLNTVNAFNSYKRNPNVIVYVVFVCLIIMESALVDFLLIRFSYYTLAKIALISSIYLIIIFLSHVKALKYRYTYFSDENLIIRYGIMNELIIPYTSIQPENNAKEKTDIVVLGLLSKMEQHNAFIRFKETISIPRIYGIRKTGNGVSLYISDTQRFNKLLAFEIKQKETTTMSSLS